MLLIDLDKQNPVNRKAPLNRGLVSWYLTLPDNSRGSKYLDLMGRNFGTLTNGAFHAYAKGRKGGFGSLSLDGSNDYASVSSTFGLGNTNVSFGCWAYLDATTKKGAFIKIGSTNTGYAIGISNGTTTGFETTGSNITILYEAVRWIPTGTSFSGVGWHHFFLVINSSGKPNMYYNGRSIFSDSGTNAVSPTGSTTQIGGYTSGVPSNRFFGGQLDDIRIYNRALSAREIRDIYTASKSGYPNELNWNRGYIRSTPFVEDAVGLTASVNDSITTTESVTVRTTLNINVNDSITCQDVLAYYQDIIFVTESVTVAIQESGTTLSVNVNDTVNLTENITVQNANLGPVSVNDIVTLTEVVTLNLISLINVNDSITVTEAVTLLNTLHINVSDTTTLTESITVSNPLDALSVSDSITLTEAVTLIVTPLNISVNDTVTITEGIVCNLTSFINVNDTATVTESVILNLISLINVNDSITITESVITRTTLNINVNDTVTITENIDVYIPFNVISVFDSITIVDAPSVQISQEGILQVTVSEDITLTESVSVENNQLGNIIVDDAITVSENITVNNALAGISVNDDIAIIEFIDAENNILNLSVNDNITVNEFYQFTYENRISVNDVIVTEENIIVANTNLGNIQVSESVSVEEFTDINLPGNIFSISVSDSILVLDNITVFKELLVICSKKLNSKIDRNLKLYSKITDNVNFNSKLINK